MSLGYRVVLSCFLLMGAIAAPAAASSSSIAVFTGTAESKLRDASVPIWGREEGVVIVGISSSQLDALKQQGIEPIFQAPDQGEDIHVLSYDRHFAAPVFPGVTRFAINGQAMLYLLPAGKPFDLPRLKLHALFHGVPRIALPPITVHPADLAGTQAPLAPLPLVQQIVDATSQASWFQFVNDLSGNSDVTIPGYCTNCRIRTRASNYMFPLNNTGNPLGNPFATEYLENKAAGWGFSGANSTRESYTSAQSGCTTRQGSMTWQNVVFTLQGQVDYAQNQQVIFLVHYDSIFNSSNDANNAPGADDAISGGSALLEAMRLFKDYAWQYPVKFLFVSGEEVGLCGSTAYTHMHSMTPVWRVLNMDQTAFDGNKDGVMNLYNWNTTSCPSCVAFGDAFVQANSDYGNIINPTKILRNTTKMCQTDHCPFWNAGVTAIDLNEDLTDNDLCPCFDQFQTSTCTDTVTQTYPVGSSTLMFDQNYSWPTEKAAIALIASTAKPLYACPATAATLSASSGPNQVLLSWPDVPPVTNYVVERAAGGCGGTFAGIASTATASYADNSVTPGSTYGYRIRTCPFQVSNCVSQTAQGSTTTTLTSSPNPSTFGQSVTFTATVSGNNGIPTGNVTFTEASTVLASNVVVDGTGHAAFSTAALSVGTHTITATFSGTNEWLNSTGNDGGSPHVVNPATMNTTTAVVGAPNPANAGQLVTFTSTTTSSSGSPTGTVSFTEGSTIWASNVPVDGAGHASFSTAALTIGNHAIMASFTGTNGWSNSSGTSAPVVVNKAGSTTTLSSSANPSVFSQAVTFTSVVSAAAGGTPTGTVTFQDGGTTLGTGTLDGSAHATLTVSTLSLGSHTITASYAGDASHTGSNSTGLGQTVNSDATTTTLASSANPSTHNQAVTFTASAVAKAPGTAIPTGTITFKDGSRTLTSVPLNGGSASLTISNLNKGTHSITAVYGGATGLLTSTSQVVSQRVQ